VRGGNALWFGDVAGRKILIERSDGYVAAGQAASPVTTGPTRTRLASRPRPMGCPERARISGWGIATDVPA
jgi:hypothetical protein